MPDLAPGIKEMLDNLPENQSGPGRHKCATCAYNEGFEAGYNEGFEAGKKHALKKAMELLKTL